MEETPGVATLVKDLGLSPAGAHWRLYRLTPPLASDEWSDGGPYEYVVVSAVVVEYSGAETYIFGANEAGEVVDWSELPGSFHGGLNHEAALTGAGYVVAPSEV